MASLSTWRGNEGEAKIKHMAKATKNNTIKLKFDSCKKFSACTGK